MTTRRGPHDADALRIDLPIRGLCTNKSHRSRSVSEHDWVTITVGAQSVAEDKSSNALLIQVERVVFAFVRRQPAISASGANDDGSSGGFILVWQIGR